MKRRATRDGGFEIELWNTEDAADLERPANIAKYDTVVAARDWTVETMIQQIRQRNINLDPAFQRRNAWRDQRRSRLIESFVLGFPVPQIVLAENPREKRTFIVIDGKQRLMTIAGLYIDEFRDYWNQPRLSGLNVLKQLNGTSLDAFLTDSTFAIERRQLGNADIRTTVITGFADEDVLYDIFYRINTGSVPLSSQELRQVLNRGAFAQYLLDVTSNPNSLWDVLRIDSPDARLRDVELMLRLVAWRRYSEHYSGNMKPFLDSAMRDLNKSWRHERASVEHLVADLFDGVSAAREVFADRVGRKLKGGQFQTALNRSLFEVQVYYFSFPAIRKAALKRPTAVQRGFEQLSKDRQFIDSIEATTKSIEHYTTRFNKYRAMLDATLDVTTQPLSLGQQARR